MCTPSHKHREEIREMTPEKRHSLSVKVTTDGEQNMEKNDHPACPVVTERMTTITELGEKGCYQLPCIGSGF